MICYYYVIIIWYLELLNNKKRQSFFRVCKCIYVYMRFIEFICYVQDFQSYKYRDK